MSHPHDDRVPDVLVVGAGLAGLACARVLEENGLAVRLLEKSRGVGGRCATRRVEGQPVDHGLAFYHGDDPGLLRSLQSIPDAPALEWPRRVEGEGAPCQPGAFRPGQWRVAFDGGVSTFPRHLARGLSVELETRVVRMETGDRGIRLIDEDGHASEAARVVLAMPSAQTAALLETLETPPPAWPSVTRLVDGLSAVRCLTVLAGFPLNVEPPEWDVCYPRESDILLLASQDSAKRTTPSKRVFVLQGRPGWSARRWDDDPASWGAELLAEAAAPGGDWMTRPSWTQTHRWRYARMAGGDALTAPLRIRLENGAVVGIAGEAMTAGGGVQAAWKSGRRLARLILGDEEA